MPITTQDEEQTRLLLSLNIQSALKLKSMRDKDETEKFYLGFDTNKLLTSRHCSNDSHVMKPPPQPIQTLYCILTLTN